MLQWLIIGGGVQGTYLSNLFTSEGICHRDDLRVIDPHDMPLALWRQNTARCGMHYLRSPAAHHIDIRISSLYRFAKSETGKPHADFIAPNFRPALNLFHHHCDWVIQKQDLARLRIKARALSIRKRGSSLEVQTTNGRIRTHNILLAIGLSEQPHWPAWARKLATANGAVAHVFDPKDQTDQLQSDGVTAVVGGGISAIQTAGLWGARGSGRTRLLIPHRVRTYPYDFDPCWIGPKCMRGFRLTQMRYRRRVIDAARRTGTAPSDVVMALERDLAYGDVELYQDEIRDAAIRKGRIWLQTSATKIVCDRVILATGFEHHRPGGALIDRLISEMGLKTANCEYPVIDPDLHWGAGIYVTGPLAELQLGPCARNIAGARNAGRIYLATQKS